MAIEPRTATRRDIPAFAPVVAEAFVDDPVFTWMFPDEHHRIRRMTRFFAADARHHMVPLGADRHRRVRRGRRRRGDVGATRTMA